MSPYYFNDDNTDAYVFIISGSYRAGSLSDSRISTVFGVVRPVISLKSCVEFEGSGKSNDPYTVKEFDNEDSCATAEN